MNEQMTINDVFDSKIILAKDLEEIEKDAKEKQMAINKASFLIDDAKARYIKEKTRARSKKIAMEKDAVLNSGRFDVLNEYERFEDIQESYGYDCITEKERDDLEELWRERERIKNHTENGVYTDLVTKALMEAWMHIQDLWMDEINKATVMREQYNKQIADAEAEYKAVTAKQNDSYRKLQKEGVV